MRRSLVELTPAVSRPVRATSDPCQVIDLLRRSCAAVSAVGANLEFDIAGVGGEVPHATHVEKSYTLTRRDSG